MKEKLNVNQIPNLKQAIIDLPEKEKNQLLLRLINKDQLLIEHLHFKLLEDEYDLIRRYEEVKEKINSDITKNFSTIINEKENINAKLLLRLIRNLSSKITHFLKVTKDVNYELSLRTILLLSTYKKYKSILLQDSEFGFKLRNYQVARIKLIYKIYSKLHHELQFDFMENFGSELEEIFLKDLANELKQAKIKFEDFKID